MTLVLGDGGLGYASHAPYDRIAITAACTQMPPPLIAQLALGGRIIAPLLEDSVQRLTVITKQADASEREVICDVLYVRLQERYGR